MFYTSVGVLFNSLFHDVSCISYRVYQLLCEDNQPVFASLGCHTDERKLFYTQKVNGILGLAPHRITGKSNVLKDLYQDHGDTKTARPTLLQGPGALPFGT